MVSPRHLLRIGVVCAGFLLAGAVSAVWAGPQPRPASPPVVLKINGAAYVDVRTVLPRQGVKSSWVERGKRARYQFARGTIELEHDNRDMVINGFRVLLGDAAVLRAGVFYVSRIDADKLLRPILAPATVPPPLPPSLRVIVIDPGHGGQDTGTQNKPLKMDEKVFALDVATRLTALLRDQGYKVIMTRTDDRFIPLPQRAEIANKAGADLFVSVHFNAVGGTPAVRGSETYLMTPQYQRSTGSPKAEPSDRESNPGNQHDAWNALLGYHMHASVISRLGSEDRGMKHARFAVLRLVQCPAVLVEAGYLSNTEEARKIATPAYRQQIAESFAKGIASYAQAITATKAN